MEYHKQYGKKFQYGRNKPMNQKNHKNTKYEQEQYDLLIKKVEENFQIMQKEIRLILELQFKIIKIEKKVQDKQTKLKNLKYCDNMYYNSLHGTREERDQAMEIRFVDQKNERKEDLLECLEIQEELKLWSNHDCDLNVWYAKGLQELHTRLVDSVQLCLNQLQSA